MTKPASQSDIPPSVIGGRNPIQPNHLNIADARGRLPRLVNDLENSRATYTIGPRNTPKGWLVSYSRMAPFLRGDYKSRLAFMVVENLLGDAPSHIRNPQLEELKQLSKDDLILLARVEQLPLDPEMEAELKEKLSDQRILSRLLKRHQIASTIASAQREGLYEAAEDQTSRVDLLGSDENKTSPGNK